MHAVPPNVPEAQGSLARLASTVRAPYAYQPRACRTHRAPCGAPRATTCPQQDVSSTTGDIAPSQVNSARVRQRGTGKRSKTNTDFEVDIQCGLVVYKVAIKGDVEP